MSSPRLHESWTHVPGLIGIFGQRSSSPETTPTGTATTTTTITTALLVLPTTCIQIHISLLLTSYGSTSSQEMSALIYFLRKVQQLPPLCSPPPIQPTSGNYKYLEKRKVGTLTSGKCQVHNAPSISMNCCKYSQINVFRSQNRKGCHQNLDSWHDV